MKKHAKVDLNLVESILAEGSQRLPIEERVLRMSALRQSSPEQSQQIDQYIMARIVQYQRGLRMAEEQVAHLHELTERLSAIPWHPAVFLRSIATQEGTRAVVQHGNARRIVALAESVEDHALQAGEEVFLGNELNIIMAVSPEGTPRCGEVAHFDRWAADSRMVLRWRDDELVMEVAHTLSGMELRTGDLIRFDRNAWMAFERIEANRGEEFMLGEVPSLSRDRVGGQEDNYETLISTLAAILVSPEKARAYDLGGRNSILLVGAPGCGKTLMTRVAASEISRMNGHKCRFAVVKPAAWESPYVGETQKAIRDTFQALAKAAEDGYAILFLDEIESIGRTRGGLANVHSDRFLAALLAELNGFEERKDVAIIAATNRKDLVDPALLERLSDVEVRVERPNLEAARAIMGIHLRPTLPFHPNGDHAPATHAEIIETAISHLYAPNADNALCKLRFRDAKERTIHARELMSGRLLEQVCRSARRRAYKRDVQGGEVGICVADMEEAISQTLERLRTTLTIHNAHSYLHDLPQDVDVVSVEPVVRRVPNARRYLNLDPI